MGPGHRLGNRPGPPGTAQAGNENGPGRLARQAFANLGRALAAAGQVLRLRVGLYRIMYTVEGDLITILRVDRRAG